MAPLRVLVLPAFAAAVAAISITDYVPACGPPCILNAVDEHTTCEAGDNACICRETYTVKRDGEVCLRDACSDSDYGMAPTLTPSSNSLPYPALLSTSGSGKQRRYTPANQDPGAVMKGYDTFCADVTAGPEPTSSTSTTEPAPPTSTASSTAYPTSTSTTEEPTPPTSYPTSAPTSSTDSPTSTTGTAPNPPETSTTSSGGETSPTGYPTSPGIPSNSTSIPTGGPTTLPTGSSAPVPPSSTGGSTPTESQPGSSEPSSTSTPNPVPAAGARVGGSSTVALLLACGLAFLGL
ncbi:hypothetical protein AAE478_004911 [Parahypoxylon ruwenzoriense]